MMNKNVDVLLISENKIDFSFTTAQFCIQGYSIPYRLHRVVNGGAILLYKKQDIPSINTFNTKRNTDWRDFYWIRSKEEKGSYAAITIETKT